MKPVLRILLGIALAAATGATPVAAHGSHVEATITRTIEVTRTVEVVATTHGSRPMADGQVTVFAPGAPEEPWLSAVCDAEGRVRFELPADAAGTWDIRVAHRGHGGRIQLEVPGEDGDTRDTITAEAIAAQPQLSTLQKAILGGGVVWGCIGTALFFARRRH
jgi:nickel transport protein